MTQNKTSIFYVEKIDRKINSYYGNPKYQLTLRHVDTQSIIVATTATNANCAYKIGYSTENTYIMATYHYTQKGNAIITGIDLLSKEQSELIDEQQRKHGDYIGNYKIVDNLGDLPKIGEPHEWSNGSRVISVELQKGDANFLYYQVRYTHEDNILRIRGEIDSYFTFSYAVRQR